MKKLLITTAALASLWLLPTACGNDDDGTTPPPTDPDSPEAPIEGYSLYWAEEFDSDELNPLNWNVETGVAANQELQYYTDRSENLRVEEGCLVIEARKEPMENREYTSARINTQGKVQIKYGYIEARIWLPAGQGTWPAFWMMGTGASSWPRCGEIDIMERLNNDTIAYQTVHSAYTYTLGIKDNPKQGGIGFINRDDYNVYSVEMYQDSLVFFINETRTFAYPRIETDKEGQFPFTDKKFYLLLDMQLGGSWVGAVDSSDLPVEMEIDWVRFYQKKK